MEQSKINKSDLAKMSVEQKRALARQILKNGSSGAAVPEAGSSAPKSIEVKPEHFRFDHFPEYLSMKKRHEAAAGWGLTFNPFFQPHHGVSGDTVNIRGKDLIGYSGYNYLGFSGHPEVTKAVIDAVELYGSSPSASRLVGGEIDLHRELEAGLADFIGTQDSVVYVSGWSTNVTTIGQIMRPGDLVLIDELVHNSLIMGCQLSGARRLSFAHNDWEQLDDLLQRNRGMHERVLVVIEGVYSMHGDIPNLPEFIKVKKKHKALLMVDEAHSIGTLGATGGGIREHFDVDASDVDVWMGTLSKSFASCGGYIAGTSALIEQLKYQASGFVYSVGLTPANTAAALAALGLLKKQPDRVNELQSNAALFLNLIREKNLDTGPSSDSPVIPVLCGSSLASMRMSQALHENGVDAKPVLYPAVSDDDALVRFFLSSLHNESQIKTTVEIVDKVAKAIGVPSRAA